MRTTFLPCLPTSGTSVPATPAWLHEIKYDGYRLIVQRESTTVHLFSRNGNDWSGRYPWIVEAALKNKHSQFVIDGEAVVLGVDGIADFNALHSREHNHEVQLYAFDILALSGEDLRGQSAALEPTSEALN
jgi:bifunctional non-homologous end joining protein LigD